MKKQKPFDMRARRTELGLTLEQVALKAGITASAVRQIEVGSFRGNFLTLQRLADALGVPARYLMTEEQLKAMAAILSGTRKEKA
jgi:transcriptional regulator with XRE-family HTH domain